MEFGLIVTGDNLDRKIVFGYAIFAGFYGAFSVKSGRESCVSVSSSEAELRAASVAETVGSWSYISHLPCS